MPDGTLGNSRPQIEIDIYGAIILAFDIYDADSLILENQSHTQIGATGNNDAIFLGKIANDGVVPWSKVIASEGLASVLGLTVDDQSSIYVSGYFYESLTIDDIVFSRTESGPGYFLCKFLIDGTIDWFHAGDYSGTSCPIIHFGPELLVSAITFRDSLLMNNQHYYSSNMVSDINMDALIVSSDPEGDVTDIYHLQGSGNLDVRAINCDGQGCIIQGKFDHELIYGSDTLTTPGPDHYSMYQIAIDNSGALQWANVSQNPQSMYLYCYGLGFTDNGEVHFSGVYDSSPFTLGDHSLPMPQGRDVFVGALDRATGEVLWLKKGIGSATDYTEAHDITGNGSLIGGFSYSPEFQYQGEAFTNTNDDQYDGFIISLDSTGKARCGLSFPGIGQNGVRAVKKTDDGHVLALVSMEQLDFAGQSYTAQGRFDLLLIKTCLPCDTLTSITEATDAKPTLQLYPNPSSQVVRVDVRHSQFKVQSLEVIDMLGNRVLNLKPETLDSELDISRLAGGIYTVAAQGRDREVLRARLVVQR